MSDFHPKVSVHRNGRVTINGRKVGVHRPGVVHGQIGYIAEVVIHNEAHTIRTLTQNELRRELAAIHRAPHDERIRREIHGDD